VPTGLRAHPPPGPPPLRRRRAPTLGSTKDVYGPEKKYRTAQEGDPSVDVYILFSKAHRTGASRQLLVARFALLKSLSFPYYRTKHVTVTGFPMLTTERRRCVPAGQRAHPLRGRRRCAADRACAHDFWCSCCGCSAYAS
jgi:hypothetical protein